jgi:hypothetical protein
MSESIQQALAGRLKLKAFGVAVASGVSVGGGTVAVRVGSGSCSFIAVEVSLA